MAGRMFYALYRNRSRYIGGQAAAYERKRKNSQNRFKGISSFLSASRWSEQNPDTWLESTLSGLCELLENADKGDVCGISFGGQMHGMVALDQNDRVVRPAILWNDGRTEKQTKYLNEVIGKKRLTELTATLLCGVYGTENSLDERKRAGKLFPC